MISSIAILLGGLGMYYFKIFWIDPVLTIFIGIYLMISGLKLLFKTVRVLMQFTPSNIDIEKIQNEIKNIVLIDNIHHVHLWELNENDIYFEAHIDINKNIQLSEVDGLLKKVREILKDKFKISHTTLQPEFSVNDSKNLINDHHNHH
jgi:cobalt-zinc-cadmium efflux system protein